MEPSDAANLALLVVLLVGGGIASWWFSPHQTLLRAIRGAPIAQVADAPDGALVRIVGTLRAGPRTLVAPLSGRACACYRVEVDRRTSSRSRKGSRWRRLIRELQSVDFEIEDASGRAIVKAHRLEVAIVLDQHLRSGTFADPGPALDAYLARHGHNSTGFLGFNKAMRYREGALEPGETIAVVGRARWEDDPEPGAVLPSSGGYREAARRKRLVIDAGDLRAVRASDDPSTFK